MKISINDKIYVDGRSYKINTGKKRYLPVDLDQLKNMARELHAMGIKHNKLYVEFFDLHLPNRGFTSNNKAISLFISQLKKALKRIYAFVRIAFSWTREQEKPTPQQHYHVVIILNGSLVRGSKTINSIIDKLWKKIAGGTVYYPPKNVYNLRRGVYKGFADVVYRMSYHAKIRPVYMKPAKTHRYGTSRVRFEDKKKR